MYSVSFIYAPQRLLSYLLRKLYMTIRNKPKAAVSPRPGQDAELGKVGDGSQKVASGTEKFGNEPRKATTQPEKVFTSLENSSPSQEKLPPSQNKTPVSQEKSALSLFIDSRDFFFFSFLSGQSAPRRAQLCHWLAWVIWGDQIIFFAFIVADKHSQGFKHPAGEQNCFIDELHIRYQLYKIHIRQILSPTSPAKHCIHKIIPYT